MAKTVLITGCSTGGIGFALVQEFQKRGLTVFATARTPAKMADLEKLPNVHLIPLDVTDPSSIAAAVETVTEKTEGKLDYLVNNSGHGYFIPALDADIEAGKRLFDVNFWGVLRMIQAFAPLLIAAKGMVVNNSSAASVAWWPYMSLYNASKAALSLFDETLRLELAPFGVGVLTLVTGLIQTEFLPNSAPQQLPPNSRYAPLQGEFEAKSNALTDGATNVTVYAKQVVGDVLARKTGKTYRGAQAGLTAIAQRWFPTWFSDRIMLKGSGLDTWKP